jgi:hypothetical protein
MSRANNLLSLLESTTIESGDLNRMEKEYASILEELIEKMKSSSVLKGVLADDEDNGPALRVRQSVRPQLLFNFTARPTASWAWGSGSITLNWTTSNVKKRSVDLGVAVYEKDSGYIHDKLVRTYRSVTVDTKKIVKDLEQFILNQ